MVMMMFLAVLFLGSVQPLMMVISLIFITLFYSFCVMKMMGSFWFSYALVMIMLSGVFVVFIYMTSLIPNEEFEIYSLVFLVILIFSLFVDKSSFLGNEYEIVSLKLWMSYVGILMMFLGMILFVIMLMVIWVSCKSNGALRVS